MKKQKTQRIISVMLALIMVMSALPIIGVHSFAENYTSGIWSYFIHEGIAIISSCSSSSSSVTIPEKLGGYNVAEINAHAFFNCKSLKEINVSSTNSYFTSVNGVLFSKDKTKLVCYPAGKTEKTYSVPNGVTSIEDTAFVNCSKISKIVLPSSLKTIKDQAFLNCVSLKDINIPNAVTYIGCYSFEDTAIYNDTSRYVDDVLYIDNCLVYANIMEEKPYTVKSGTRVIAGDAFFLNGITSIIIPNSVICIGAGAFQLCASLESVIIPNSVDRIYNDTFSECYMLSEVTIPNSVKSIDDGAFYNTSLKTVTIPNSVTTIGNNAFLETTNLTHVTIPDSVKEIGDCAFGYYLDYDIEDISANKSFYIFGKKGSAAEKYARDNNFKFYEIGTFPDVPKNAWYYDSVKYVAQKSYITGYTNGKFGPTDSLKRQDFVVILARIAKADLTKYQNTTSKLKDVQKGAYYAPSVNWAVDSGIIAGYNNGKFGVNDPITREQVAVILYRYMGEPKVSNVNGTLIKFKDAKNVSSFATTALAWAVQNGIINGTMDGKVNSTKSASRAEIAAIIMNMDKAGMFK